MYNPKDIQFVGKHDYDEESAKKFASHNGKTFSVNIFQWVMMSSSKKMKPGKGKVRVHGSPGALKAVLEEAERIVIDLDKNEWDGRKNVFVK